MDQLLTAIGNAGLAARCFAADEADIIPRGKGAYILLMKLDKSVDLELRGRAAIRLEPGWFAYAGSARGPGGIRARLRRHFRRDKALHWHIDRLTNTAGTMAAVTLSEVGECGIIDTLLRSTNFEVAVLGFGNSDCRTCTTHLLRFSGRGIRP